jgi:uncharacterized protein (DUF2267 family)
LSTFASRIPADERRHLFTHLPVDVTGIAAAPRRAGAQFRTVPEFIGIISAQTGLTPKKAESVAEAVLATLRTLVPEEARDISATLPEELQRFWDSAVPVS